MNKNLNRPIHILHFSTHNENCGIARYQELFIESLKTGNSISNEFFSISPNILKNMSRDNQDKSIEKLVKRLKNFDILHIQHEFSFFKDDEMGRIIKAAKKEGVKTIVTVHTSPNIIPVDYVNLTLNPRSVLHNIKTKKKEKWLDRIFFSPLRSADLVIVHNEVTKQALRNKGVKEENIRKLIIPVPKLEHSLRTNHIRRSLAADKSTIVLSTVGFLHRYKGLKQAIKALRFLPDNYKLAIIGGLHPHTNDIKIYDELADLIMTLDLQSRVYITGYIENEDLMNAYIRETDICIFAYDKDYYSNVSSAALNNAFANHIPALAYPTASFLELNQKKQAIYTTNTFSYYELAQLVKFINQKEAKEKAVEFAKEYSYEHVANDLKTIYYAALKS